MVSNGEHGWGEWAALLCRAAVKRYGLSWEDAQDISQDVVRRVLPRVDRIEELPRYLFRALKNSVIAHRKGVRRRREQSLEEPLGCDGTTLADVLAVPELSPEDAIAAAEVRRLVLRELRAILRHHQQPQRDWLIFVASAIERRPADEVAREHGVKPQTVYNVVHRIQAALRRRLLQVRP